MALVCVAKLLAQLASYPGLQHGLGTRLLAQLAQAALGTNGSLRLLP